MIREEASDERKGPAGDAPVDARSAEQWPIEEQRLLGKVEVSRRIQRIEDQLTEVERRILALHLQGRPVTEIAKTLGCARETASNHLTRIRKLLAQ